jgi:hypothetical protein
MKKLSFFRFSSAFILFLWLFGHFAHAQQLICPSPIAEPGASGVPFYTDWDQNLSSGTNYIPTVVHLIGDASALTFNQVKSAIDQLNADFVDPNGTHTIVFVLATIGEKGQCEDGITRHPNIQYNDAYKQMTAWPNDRYLNIWVLSDPVLGGKVEVQPSSYKINKDGVLERTDRIAGQDALFDEADGISINTGEIYPNWTGGNSLTHETGHWLNLLHVFSPCNSGVSPFLPVWDCCHGPNEGSTQGDFLRIRRLRSLSVPPIRQFAVKSSLRAGLRQFHWKIS